MSADNPAPAENAITPENAEKPKSFVHLHVHTEYSLLDGCNRIKPMVAKAKELGMPALAITDHGVMFGCVGFYTACREAGIKPLIGCEVYVATRTRHDKDAQKDKRPYHLTLIAKDRQGYSNLCQIVSAAYLEGFYYKPRVDHELLQKHHEGLVCLTGCLRGEVNDALLQDNYDLARQRLKFLYDTFGDDLFVELMNHGLAEQAKTNPLLIKLAKEFNIPVVATNDAHYLNKEDASIQDILICVATGKTLDDPKRMRMSCDEFYLKSREEMLEAFDFCPEAVDNTLLVADKVDFEMEFDHPYLPKFPVPEGKTSEEYLIDLCKKGMIERFGCENPGEEYMARLKKELDVIIGQGFPDYFLLVWDFINWSQRHGIPVGPGRGSAAGSLVAYLIGITQLNPLPHDLLFERFLNPERKDLPDIDTDFCVDRRGEVIQYCRERYGNDRVAQIATFGRMKAKNALRDVGRVMGISLADVDKIAKAVPNDLKATLSTAMETPAFRQLYDSSPMYKRLVDEAMRCEGVARNSGIHAAGVIISSQPLPRLVPLHTGPNGEVVVQYDMSDSSHVGMVKMDFLGLRNLTIIKDCLNIIKYSRGIDLDLSKLEFTDPETYKLLGDADTTGVFQLESDGMKRYLRQLKPDRFSDIVAFLALYRPGPIKGGVVDDFIARRHGKGGPIVYPHPKLENILKDTYGFFLYQEQVMLTAATLAGYTMAEADKLRKAMGKKKIDIMNQHEIKFVEGAVERGTDRQVAADIFLTMKNFAAYGFNKSHSAAYAMVSYHTAYLKTHYRPEYMAALLTSVMNTIERVSFFMAECKRSGIAVLGPDINESRTCFSVYNLAIRWGLAALRGVGRAACDHIIAVRDEGGPFKDLVDFFSRIDGHQVNKKVLEALIKAGALDCFKETRATLMLNMDNFLDFNSQLQKEAQSGQFGLFDDFEDAKTTVNDLVRQREEEFAPRVLLDFEKEMLGIYLSGSPLSEHAELLKSSATPVARIPEMGANTRVTVGGLLVSQRVISTKTKETMAFLQLEDLEGNTIEVVVRPKCYARYMELCQAGKIVLVKGIIDARAAVKPKPEPEPEDDLDEEDDDGPAPVVVEEEPQEPELEYKISADDLGDVDEIAMRQRKSGRPTGTMHGLNIAIYTYQTDCLSPLRDLLIKHSGRDLSVYIHVKSQEKTSIIQLDPSLQVHRSPDLIKELEDMLGQGSVAVK